LAGSADAPTTATDRGLENTDSDVVLTPGTSR
jgi:hypothetical protein